MAQQVRRKVCGNKIVTLESLQPPMNESLESHGARRQLETSEGPAAASSATTRSWNGCGRRRRTPGRTLMITVQDREVVDAAERARAAGRRSARRSTPAASRPNSAPASAAATGSAGSSACSTTSIASRRIRWYGPRRRSRSAMPRRREDRDGRRLGHGPLRRAEDRRADPHDRRLRAADAPRRRLLLRHGGGSAGALSDVWPTTPGSAPSR